MPRVVRGGLIQAVLSEPATSPVEKIKKSMIDKHVELIAQAANRGVQALCLQELFYGPYFPAEQNRKVLTPERVESIMRHTPADRFGDPEELAGAIVMMASNKAGSFLNGANIVVDGGWTAW